MKKNINDYSKYTSDKFDHRGDYAAWPFPTKAYERDNTTEYNGGWGGNTYVPEGLASTFSLSLTEQLIGPVTNDTTGLAFGSPSYMGPYNGDANVRGKDEGNGGTMLGQFAKMLNAPQDMRGGSEGSAKTWQDNAAVEKFRITLGRYRQSIRSQVDVASNLMADGSYAAVQSGGPWRGYTPVNDYHSERRMQENVIAKVLGGRTLTWDDLSNQDGDMDVDFQDFFQIADEIGKLDTADEVSSPVGIVGGFGSKRMIMDASISE